MDPKKAEQIRNSIDSVVGPLNMLALAHYAKLLQTCGVRQPRIFKQFFLP